MKDWKTIFLNDRKRVEIYMGDRKVKKVIRITLFNEGIKRVFTLTREKYEAR